MRVDLSTLIEDAKDEIRRAASTLDDALSALETANSSQVVPILHGDRFMQVVRSLADEDGVFDLNDLRQELRDLGAGAS